MEAMAVSAQPKLDPRVVRGDFPIFDRPMNGKPLYTFAEDSGPNTVTGNGAKDAFGGTSFTWHVAAPGAVTTTSTSGGGGYGY